MAQHNETEEFATFADALNKKSEFIDRRLPENEATKHAIHAAGLCRRRKHVGPERRQPENQRLRKAVDARIEDMIVRNETPVINSRDPDVYAFSAMEKCRRTGEWYPMLGHPDGVLID